MQITERRIGRYVLAEPVGQGATGVVYRAEDPVIHRTVAVKVLGTDKGLTDQQVEQARARFMQEGQSAASIDHPNIIRVFDVGEDDDSGDMYIVMEFVPGPTLETVLRDQTLEIEKATALIGQIASGLDAAHARGIIHRDIKPSNILLTDDGTVKIADFGITQVATSTLTQDMRVIGSPAYMSPEQVGGKDLDSRADLFSLGVLSYEMLAGRKPFCGDDIVSVAHAIVYENPAPMSVVNPELSQALDPVMERILAKVPANRFASGKEFHEALIRCVAGESTSRGPTRVPQTSQRPRAVWALLGVAVVAAILMFVSRGVRTDPPDAVASSHVGPTGKTVQPGPARAPVPGRTGKAPPTKKPASRQPAKRESEDSSAPKTSSVSSLTPIPIPTPNPTAKPAQPESLPSVAKATAVVPAVSPASVTISFAHRLRRGRLVVFVDGVRVFDERFSKAKLAMVQTTIWDPFEAPVGRHTLKAKVTSEDGAAYVSDSHAFEFPGGQDIEFRIGLKGDALTVEKRNE